MGKETRCLHETINHVGRKHEEAVFLRLGTTYRCVVSQIGEQTRTPENKVNIRLYWAFEKHQVLRIQSSRTKIPSSCPLQEQSAIIWILIGQAHDESSVPREIQERHQSNRALQRIDRRWTGPNQIVTCKCKSTCCGNPNRCTIEDHKSIHIKYIHCLRIPGQIRPEPILYHFGNPRKRFHPRSSPVSEDPRQCLPSTGEL